MRKYLRLKDSGPKRKDAPDSWRLSFSAVEKDIPDLAERVILLRSRVKELAFHFERDGNKALKWFHGVSLGTIVVGALIFWDGMRSVSATSPEKLLVTSTAVVLMGGIAALLAAGASSLGLHQRYSALFAGKWAMKALETNIDQIVFDMAREASERGRLTPAEVKRLQAYIDSWLAGYTTALMAFGDKYGSSFRPVMTPELKLPAR